MDSLETYRDFLKGFWWDERDKIMTAHKRGLKPPPAQKPHPGDAPIFNLVPIEKIGIGDVSVTEAIRRRRSLPRDFPVLAVRVQARIRRGARRLE